jgi:hypothetical protein
MDRSLQRNKKYFFQIIKIKKFGKKKCNPKYNTWKSMDGIHKGRFDGGQKLQ